MIPKNMPQTNSEKFRIITEREIFHEKAPPC